MQREDWAATAALFVLIAALAGIWIIYDGVRMDRIATVGAIALLVIIVTGLLVLLALWITDRIESERREIE